MSESKLLTGVLVAALIFLSYQIFKGAFGSEEEKIKKIISQTKDIVENRDILAFSGRISNDYQDEEKRDYATVLAIARHTFFRFEELRVVIYEAKIQFPGDDAAIADIDFTFWIKRGGLEGFLLGQPENPCHIKVFYQKEADDWLINSSTGIDECLRAALPTQAF